MTHEIEQAIHRLYDAKRNEKKTRFNRTTSFGDYFTDRWDRARFEGFGDGTSVYDNVLVIGDVKVGRHCWIGPNVILDGTGGLEIGDYVDVSAGAQVYSHHTVRRCLSSGVHGISKCSTVIGSNVYIGPNAVIQMGVRIGSNVIIGALSFIDKDIDDFSVVYGVPGRVAGRVEDYLIQRQEE